MNARAAGRRCVGAVVVLLLASFVASGLVPVRARAGHERILRRERMIALTNADRRDRDRARLTLNDRLSRIARRHSRQMAERGRLFHSSTKELIDALSPYPWTLGGENVGVADTLETLEAAFMNSKEHRRNILRRRFDHAAAGIVRVDGRLWVTVVFYG
jgi:uncharacterized protein YkwD